MTTRMDSPAMPVHGDAERPSAGRLVGKEQR